MNKWCFVDEVCVMLDEFLFFSVEMAWDFRIRFPIFIATSILKRGFHPLIRKQTNLFL